MGVVYILKLVEAVIIYYSRRLDSRILEAAIKKLLPLNFSNQVKLRIINCKAPHV